MSQYAAKIAEIPRSVAEPLVTGSIGIQCGARRQRIVWTGVVIVLAPLLVLNRSVADETSPAATPVDASAATIAAGLPIETPSEPTTSRPAATVAAANELSATIDRWISARWVEAGLRPASPADDAEFLRRVFLDLAGRLPSRAEQQAFRADASQAAAGSDRGESGYRQAWIDRLIASDEFALHFANQIHAHLLGRTAFLAPAEWHTWLRTAVTQDKGWHGIVREMLVADAAEVGAHEFLVRRLSAGEALDQVTRDVTRLVFGVDMQCARCHTHPEIPEWEPESYWGMAAFFNRTYLVEIDGRKRIAERARGEVQYVSAETKESHSTGPRFMTGGTPSPQDPPPTEPEDRIAQRKTAFPKAKPDDPLLDNPDEYMIPPAEKPSAPSQPRYSRRHALIDLAINQDNPYFAKAFVNRVWAWLMGQGLVEPLDQLHAANRPSHPELLDALAADFVAHDYSIRRLVAGVVGSRAYQLSSVRLSPAERPADPVYYVQAGVRPLAAHQLATATLCAVGFYETDGSRVEFEKRQADRLSALVKRLDTGSDQFQPSIPLALYLANSEEFDQWIGEGGLLGQISALGDDAQAIHVAFETVLSRAPDADELATLRSFLSARADRSEAAKRQMIWSLLTSSEFRFTH